MPADARARTGAGGGGGLPPRPRATALVCTVGRETLLGDALRSVVAALGPDDELIVVEAISHVAEEALAALGDGPWQSIHLERPGKSRQLNAGLAAADSEVVVITDDDCEVAPGWVEAMARAFDEPGVGIAFGPVRGLSQAPGASRDPVPSPPGPAHAAIWRYSHGASLAVRREAALDVGGFDERLGPGAPLHGEEADLLLRMEAAGWRCWIADAPVVEHVEWRTPAEELENRFVYERGWGAWLGAALRRDPRRAARLLGGRMRYQAGILRHAPSRRYGVRALAEFAAGLGRGLTLRPRRFLEPDGSSSGPGVRTAPRGPAAPGQGGSRPAATEAAAISSPVEHERGWQETIELAPGVTTPGRFDQRDALVSLPWPTVHGQRCLDLDSGDAVLALELERRGAAEVVYADLDPEPAEGPSGSRFELLAELTGSRIARRRLSLVELDPRVLGRFDVVVADGFLSRTADPSAAGAALASLCNGFLLSVEPLDPLLSLVAGGRRGRGPTSPGSTARRAASATWHRRLLEDAGFTVHAASHPYLARERHASGERTRRAGVLGCLLTGESGRGVVKRALLCRPPGRGSARMARRV